MATESRERAKLLGNLIQEAREHARQPIEACAAVLQISPEAFANIEAGTHDVSLPDLEVLALFLDVPMGYFWGTQSLEEPQQVDYQSWVTLRNRVIGVLLNQIRLKSKMSIDELAEQIEVTPEQIQAYERGEMAVPYIHLEALSRLMGASPADFLDDERGPMGRHEAQHKLNEQFKRMSPEMLHFFANPVNVSYLDTAKRISEMDVEKLRQVAENLLEITY